MQPPDRADRELTGEFWAGVDRGELLRPVCGRCGRSFFCPQVVCPHCAGAQWSYEPSAGLGVVYSFTVVHRPPEPAFEAPYVLAIVDVAEGWSLLTWIVDCPADEVRIGMQVQVRFVPGPDRALLPAFAPRPESAGAGEAAA
ncbi:MAG: Zn-ribbon domain-containing OB-fold protein [bacterium]|nr:Zn-ribbon domain-containing OB-fold protein [bacterium]MCY3924424.1 Zn-ribbon domain-containing OB-fold protein [bacterium]